MKTILNISLLIIFLTTVSCEKTFYQPEPNNDAEAIFENLWNEFNNHYAPFEERGVDWNEQYQIYRPMVSASTSDEELADIFKQMLGTLNDCHVYLTMPNEPTWRSNKHVNEKIEDELFDLELIKSHYLKNDFKINGYEYNTYGWIGNVGYVHMVWVSDNMYDFDAILDYFKDAKGLIIDYRHNGGGQFMWGYESAGRLTNKSVFTHKSKTKNGTGPDDYTDWYDWYLEPKGAYFDKPIVYLTDRYTISAAERMTYAFKALPNVTHMGDTTNGAIATIVGRELANGWKYSIVTQKIEGFDGKYYEGVGIPPEIYIKNTMDEMAEGIDKTLEKALEEF